MAHIIDIILVALIVLIAFIGSKRGIILTVFDLLSGIASFLIAKLLSPFASEFVYDNFLKKTTLAFLTEKYNGVENSLAEAVGSITSVFDFLPEGIMAFVKSADMFDASSVSHNIMSSITTVEQLEEQIVAPVMMVVLNLICFAVISFVSVIILRIVGRFISGIVSKFKFTEKINSLLGGVFGIVKGVVYVFIIAVIISIVSFSSETVASYAGDSYICAFAAQLIGL